MVGIKIKVTVLKKHFEAIEKHGVTEFHRKTFFKKISY